MTHGACHARGNDWMWRRRGRCDAGAAAGNRFGITGQKRHHKYRGSQQYRANHLACAESSLGSGRDGLMGTTIKFEFHLISPGCCEVLYERPRRDCLEPRLLLSNAHARRQYLPMVQWLAWATRTTDGNVGLCSGRMSRPLPTAALPDYLSSLIR
jgi:hypothetical protein